jgi:2,4-dienoyl-CoA reductase-like NADH-dependent reductase (Old Yellow Enzyme family)
LAQLRCSASYGGTFENRARFAVEVAAAIADEISPECTAIRLSPGAPLRGLVEGADGPDLYRHLVGELDLFHFGDDALLADPRQLSSKPLMLLRAARTLERLGADVFEGILVLPLNIDLWRPRQA